MSPLKSLERDFSKHCRQGTLVVTVVVVVLISNPFWTDTFQNVITMYN